MDNKNEIVAVKIAGDKVIRVEATVIGGEEDVAYGIPSIDGLSEAIEGVASSILAGLDRIKPRKATVEFGVEVALESGHLTALLVKGTGNASVKVTLEWGA